MVFIMDLNSLSVPTNILLLIATAYYANITRCMLNQSKKEQRTKDIKENLKCFYHPVKDILEVSCSLFQMNREVSKHHSEPKKSLQFGNIEYHTIEHSEKMTKLRNEYLSRKKILT